MCKVDIGLHCLIILMYMCSEQQWDKQYQITNQYLDRFSRNLYFVALEVGVSVYSQTLRHNKYTVGSRKLWSVFITINCNGSINKIEENWENPTFFIQDGGYLFTN